MLLVRGCAYAFYMTKPVAEQRGEGRAFIMERCCKSKKEELKLQHRFSKKELKEACESELVSELGLSDPELILDIRPKSGKNI